MSFPRYRLVLSPQARHDLRDILQHSLDCWGLEQQERYAALLEGGLRLLQDFPSSGRERGDLWPSCRAYVVDQHTILYEIVRQRIRVVRVLSNRQDFRRILRG